MPNIYSLGPPETFQTLGYLIGCEPNAKKCWRKVARAISKYNRELPHRGMTRQWYEARAQEYMSRAIRDMRLPYLISMELCSIYSLPANARFIRLTQSAKLASMTP